MRAETLSKAPGYMQTREKTRDKEIADSSALGKYTRSFGLSVAITSVLSSLLVVEKALSKGLFNWMTATTSHHWITHGAFDLLAFAVIGFVLAQLNGGTGVRVSTKGLATAIVRASVISSLLIAVASLLHGWT